MKRNFGLSILLSGGRATSGAGALAARLVLAVFFVLSMQAQISAKEATGKNAAKVTKTSGATRKNASPSHVVPAGVTVNACGCYRTEAGSCFCGDKNGKCACPGECEPIACEQKRSKEIQREIAAETKKAQDEEKKRLAEEAATQRAAQAAAGGGANQDEATISDDSTDPPDETAAKKVDQSKSDKSDSVARKGRKRVAKP